MIVDRTHQCDGWRERIGARHDACHDAPHDQDLRPPDSDGVSEHLARCPACRAYADDLEAIGAWIRATPARALPADALDEIWARTVDRLPVAQTTSGSTSGSTSIGPRGRRRLGGTAWGLAAAAVVVLSIGATLVLGLRPATVSEPALGYSEAELDRIDRDLRLAMTHLAGAVASAERIAVEDVLVGEASAVLRHLPLSTHD